MTNTTGHASVSGEILTYTIINVPTPEFAGESPYALAIIKTAEGAQMLVRIKGESGENINIGQTAVYDDTDDHGAVYRLS